jgi:predicted PurR-regulated permease PerM
MLCNIRGRVVLIKPLKESIIIVGFIMEQKMRIDISSATVVKIILAVFGVWFIYTIRDILVLVFIVLVVVAAIAPLVDKMEKYMPRIIAMLILSIVLLGFLVAVGFLVLPPVINQIGQLAANLPAIIDQVNPIFRHLQTLIGYSQESLLNLSSQLGGLSSGIYATTVNFVGGIVAIVTIFVLSFYLLLEKDAIRKSLRNFVPTEHEERVFIVTNKIAIKMGNWLRGQGLLMLIIAILDGIALVSLGVPYALTLAVWGGLVEVIPYIGPWLGLAPAAIIAYTVSPLMALLVVIAYILIQELEGHLLVPKIMGKAVGLSPVIIILALLVGAKIMGLSGIFIAVPAAAAISVIFQDWSEVKKLIG